MRKSAEQQTYKYLWSLERKRKLLDFFVQLGIIGSILLAFYVAMDLLQFYFGRG